MYSMTEQELLQAISELQAECKDRDSRIIAMEYKIKDLEYQVKMLNELLNLKKAWRDVDVDGRC